MLGKLINNFKLLIETKFKDISELSSQNYINKVIDQKYSCQRLVYKRSQEKHYRFPKITHCITTFIHVFKDMVIKVSHRQLKILSTHE